MLNTLARLKSQSWLQGSSCNTGIQRATGNLELYAQYMSRLATNSVLYLNLLKTFLPCLSMDRIYASVPLSYYRYYSIVFAVVDCSITLPIFKLPYAYIVSEISLLYDKLLSSSFIRSQKW